MDNGSTLRIARPKTYTEQYNGVSNMAGATNMGAGGMQMAQYPVQGGQPQGQPSAMPPAGYGQNMYGPG